MDDILVLIITAILPGVCLTIGKALVLYYNYGG